MSILRTFVFAALALALSFVSSAYAQEQICTVQSAEENEVWTPVPLTWTHWPRLDRRTIRVDVGKAPELTARLDGRAASLKIGPYPKPHAVLLQFDTLLEFKAAKPVSVEIALMDSSYSKSGMESESWRQLDRDLETLDRAFRKFRHSLSDKQKAELQSLGFTRVNISKPLSAAPRFSAEAKPVLITVLDRPGTPPRDLYAHGERLTDVQAQYKRHIDALRNSRSSFEAASKDLDTILPSIANTLLASEFVRVETRQAQAALKAVPNHSGRLAEIKAEIAQLEKDLDALKKPDNLPKLFVYVPMKRTSPSPRAGYTEIRAALADAQDGYDNLLEKLKADFAQGRGDFDSLDDIENSPSLTKLRQDIDWLNANLKKLEESLPDETGRRADIQAKIKALKSEERKLRTEQDRTWDAFETVRKRVEIELRALGNITKTTPPNVMEDGSARNTAILLQLAETYAEKHASVARKTASQTKAEIDDAFADWSAKDAALSAHTGQLLDTRKSALVAICTAYKQMSDNGPYKEALDMISKQIQILSYAPTAAMMPTLKNIELAGSGKLEDSYRRSLNTMGRKAVIDVITYNSDMADDLSLIAKSVHARDLAYLQRRDILDGKILDLEPIPGRSKMEHFKDGISAFDKTMTGLSTAKTIYDTAELYAAGDPRAAFKGMKGIMGGLSVADSAVGLVSQYGIYMPIHASLISVHLSILADAGIASIDAANRIADRKIDDALTASFTKSARTKLYSLRDLKGAQQYKTYVNDDEIMQRIATRYQTIYILNQIAQDPSK